MFYFFFCFVAVFLLLVLVANVGSLGYDGMILME
jgi:hypothetical protein